MRETRVRSLALEDPLEKGMATHLSILGWRIPWKEEEPGGLKSMGFQRVRQDWVTTLSFTVTHRTWMTKPHPFCPSLQTSPQGCPLWVRWAHPPCWDTSLAWKTRHWKALEDNGQALAGSETEEKSLGLITEQLAPKGVDFQGKVFI